MKYNIVKRVFSFLILFFIFNSLAFSDEADDILTTYGANEYPAWVADATIKHKLTVKEIELYRKNANFFANKQKTGLARNLISIVIANSTAKFADWHLLIQQGLNSQYQDVLLKALNEAAYAHNNVADSAREKSTILFLAGDILQRQGKLNTTSIIWQKALSLNKNHTYQEKLNALEKTRRLGTKPKTIKKTNIDNLYARSYKNKVALCLRFDNFWRRIDNFSQEYKQYFNLKPAHDFDLRNDYGELCLDNLKPSTNYQLTVDKSMPLSDEYKLQKTQTLSSVTKDFTPNLEFTESGYILANNNKISVPIASVNLSEARVKLIHVNDRNLLPSIHKFALRRNINQGDEQQYIEQSGELIFDKILKLNVGEKNQKSLTATPLANLKSKPGLYILTASKIGEELYTYDELNTQWLIVSDTGLFTLEADDYLHIFAQKLSDAEPRKSLKLSLLSRANEVLATAISDKTGYAKIPSSMLRGSGGKAAKLLLAYGADSDFSLIDLSRPEHDFSDRGVKGRSAPGPVDVFLYSNRNLFKPGETVEIHGLIRDKSAKSLANLQVQLKLISPEQKAVATTALNSDASGYINWQTSIPSSAKTGSWRVEIYAGSDKPVGTYDFLLEDFVPPKIKAKLSAAVTEIIPGKKIELFAKTQFLHGAPLTGADANLDITIQKNPEPFADFPGFVFGDIREHFISQKIDLKTSRFTTDTNGKIAISLAELKNIYNTSLPLKARINLAILEPGGRPFNTGLDLLYKNQNAYIGLKPAFSNGRIDSGAAAVFQLVFVKNTKPSAIEINYTLVQEEENGYWIETAGKWKYQQAFVDGAKIKTGKMKLAADKANVLEFEKLDWGTYRLDVSYKDIRTSYRFVSGNQEAGGRAIADKLKISSDKQEYKANAKVRLKIKPEYDGPILINVLNKQLLKQTRIMGKAGKTQEVELTADAGWGAGAYIMASSFHQNPNSNRPNRAIGLVYVKIEDKNNQLALYIAHESQIESETKLDLEINTKSKVDTFLTVALVDEGILNLTNYAPPDPVSWFFSQLGLAVKVRDIYGDLIRAQGEPGEFRTGGDGGMLLDLVTGGAPQNLRKIVALSTQKLKVGPEGKSKVSFNVPEYQGALKVLAVAWNKDAVGSATSTVIVKDNTPGILPA